MKEYKLPESANTCYFEINQNALLKLRNEQQEINYSYESLQDQIVRRDLCFVIDQSQTYEELMKAIKKVTEVRDVQVFDLYQGTNLPEGKKSVSLKIKIKGDGTMTTEEINAVMDKTIEEAKKV